MQRTKSHPERKRTKHTFQQQTPQHLHGLPWTLLPWNWPHPQPTPIRLPNGPGNKRNEQSFFQNLTIEPKSHQPCNIEPKSITHGLRKGGSLASTGRFRSLDRDRPSITCARTASFHSQVLTRPALPDMKDRSSHLLSTTLSDTTLLSTSADALEPKTLSKTQTTAQRIHTVPVPLSKTTVSQSYHTKARTNFPEQDTLLRSIFLNEARHATLHDNTHPPALHAPPSDAPPTEPLVLHKTLAIFSSTPQRSCPTKARSPWPPTTAQRSPPGPSTEMMTMRMW